MHLKSTQWGDAIFFWNSETDPQRYEDFRVPSPDDKSRRNLEHIPPEETAAAIKFILSQQIGLAKEDLERELSRIFGFARCTEAMQKHIMTGIKIAINRKWATVDGNRVNAIL